jgi:Tfp pilus assembly protein PilE
MNNTKKQAGFSFLELLIALVLIIALSIISFALVYHYSRFYNQTTRIQSSIRLLHNAANDFYFNEIYQKINPKVLTISNLKKHGYINQKNIFKLQHLYRYRVMYQDSLIKITVRTREGVNLDTLRPTNSKVLIKYHNRKKYYVYLYIWDYPVNRPIYPNT